MSNATHYTQLKQQLQEHASRFVSTWSNRLSLITITDVLLSKKADRAVFLVSVFPEDAEGPALGFLMRKRGECREYLREHVRLARVPHVEFALDEGEKNRQKVEELLR